LIDIIVVVVDTQHQKECAMSLNNYCIANSFSNFSRERKKKSFPNPKQCMKKKGRKKKFGKKSGKKMASFRYDFDSALLHGRRPNHQL